jgi:glc operon protein GlcG
VRSPIEALRASSDGLHNNYMLTIEIVKEIAARAVQEASAIPCAMSIVLVDSGANLIYAERMDDAMIATFEVAHRKARSAVLFRRPTKVFEDMLAGGRMAILKLPGAIPLEGGVPLMADGKVVGGIGASGGTAQQDGIVANAAAAALAELLPKTA